MGHLQRDSVNLYYEEEGKGNHTFVFIHGTGGDNTHLQPVIHHIAKNAKAVAFDLRGHGKSDKPSQGYTIERFADDIQWACNKLGISRPILVGFSMGGNIALELATKEPNFASAVIILDSAFLYSENVLKIMQQYRSELFHNEFHEAIEKIIDSSCLPTDQHKKYVAKSFLTTPQFVWQSAFDSMLKWDQSVANKLSTCKIPILYIEAAHSIIDKERVKELCPQIVYGKVIGSGHFVALEVPNQVNAMIDRFVDIYVH